MPADSVRVLFFGDVFGHPGRNALVNHLRDIRAKHDIDICAVNAENAAGGNGITPKIADALFACGVDVITLGDHAWDRMESESYLNTTEAIIRPVNYPDDAPGRGMTIIETSSYKRVCFINLMGRVFMKPADNPFTRIETVLASIDQPCPVRVVDFHAEATSEKVAMGRFLDGKVSAVLGTHTHIPTADACILPGGTAYITDVGMTGPCDSIIGLNAKEVLLNYRLQVKRRFEPATGDVRMQGVVVVINTSTGKAEQITPVEERVDG